MEIPAIIREAPATDTPLNRTFATRVDVYLYVARILY